MWRPGVNAPSPGLSAGRLTGHKNNVSFAFHLSADKRFWGAARERPRGVDMTEITAVEAATTRLERALQALEEAVDYRLDRDRGRGDLAEQVHSLGVDRARLASELDASVARARRLEDANRAVAERLDAAVDTIRTVIAGEQ